MLNASLNPIYDYAAKGQYYEQKRAWENSIRWYHRALACLPNLYGAEKKIRLFPLMGAKPVSFTRQHAGRIYAALGRCLMALDRREDSLLAFQAAHGLDPENIPTQRRIHADSDIILNKGAESDISARSPGQSPHVSNTDLKAALTLIIITHCTQRLRKFEALSPPSCKLVTATYGSLLKVFGEDICVCPKVLCYDHNPNGSARDNQYARSLERFSRQQGFELTTYPGVGLFNILNRTISTVTTPYIFFVEHDWLFRGNPIQLNAIVEMMNQNPNMHSVRFNKRDNHIDGHDFILSLDTAQKNYPLLRTSSHSNNPSIIRTDKLKKEWLPKCEQALQRVTDNLSGSAYGVEEILFKHHVEDIRNQGFDVAHAAWGTHVFGQAGDPPRVVHLGE